MSSKAFYLGHGLILGFGDIPTDLGYCRNPTLKECEDETHTPEMRTWESSKIPKTLEFDCRGQNISHWGVL
jgi:hypothetical protein